MRSLTLAVVLGAGLAGMAQADDYIGFQSPTGNIHCGLYVADGGQSFVRCDLMDLTPSYTRAPAGCEFDWGFAFGVESEGKGYLACVSDAVADPGNPVLPYGEAISAGGISCVSAKTGMTCTNGEGHGFSVARAKQRIF